MEKLNKIFIYGVVMILPWLTFAQSGVLDPTFGEDGIALTELTSFAYGEGLAFQSDGKTIVVGYAGNNGLHKMAVARYNIDGTLGETFGDSGTLLLSPTEDRTYASNVATLPDDKIILGGRSWNVNSLQNDFVLIKLNADGSLNDSFGTDGIVVADAGGDEVVHTMALLENGKILLAGYKDDNFAIARFNSNGDLDETFGDNGWSTIEFTNSLSFANDIAVQQDGKIVLAGFGMSNTAPYEMLVARIQENGSIDNSFGTDGKVRFNIGNGHDVISSLAIQNDGKILLGGYTWTSDQPLSYDLAIIRLNEDGTFDTSYGTGDGITTLQAGPEADYTRDLILQENEKTILVGYTAEGQNARMMMARFDDNGDLDETFGDQGVTITDVNGSNDYAGAGAIDQEGRIVLTGDSYMSTEGKIKIVTARYTNESLGIDNLQTTDFQIYPNPVEDQLNIQYADPSTQYTIEIFNMLGQKLIYTGEANQKQVDVSSLAAGTYIIKFKNSQGSTTKRFIKK